VTRLRQLYLDLAQAVLGVHLLGGGGLAPAGFSAMVSGLEIRQFYASGEAVEATAAKQGRPPITLVSFDAAHAGDFDDEYHMAYVGTLPARGWPPGLVRQVGAMVDGRIVNYEDLEGELDINGLEYVECVMAIAARSAGSWHSIPLLRHTRGCHSRPQSDGINGAQLLAVAVIYRTSADEYVAVITCARSRPETRSGREARVVHEGVPCSPPSNQDRPTTSPQAQPARPRITR
jgi:hypothetical protein